MADLKSTFLYMEATDHGGGNDQLCYSCTAPCPAGLDVDPDSGQVIWRPSSFQQGSYIVSMSASDPFGGATTQLIPLVVRSTSGIPQIQPITLDEGTMRTITLPDQDSMGRTLTYHLTCPSEPTAPTCPALTLTDKVITVAPNYDFVSHLASGAKSRVILVSIIGTPANA